jgi:alpha-tubulin suppressor-like RCC1 family protein
MKLMLNSRATTGGFALPTLLIVSIAMLTILVTAVSATSTISSALNSQYYSQLAREAAESGVARALECLSKNPASYTPQWSNAAPLKPNTDCSGVVQGGLSAYVLQSGNVQSSFSVGLPTAGANGALQIVASATLGLTRTGSSSVWRTYSQTLAQTSRYQSTPSLAGGAGWKGNGHLAAVMTLDKKLYALGDNSLGQITDSQTPTSVSIPRLVSLPAGVSSISSVVTSGQGASFMCIMANTSQVWCRGAAGAGENGLMPATIGWQRFGLPGSLTAVSMSISGFGPVAMCVIASDGQAYCAGENYSGSLGIGDSSYSIYKITNPQKFRLDVPAPGASLRKIVTQSDVTCGITTTNDMYCAGINWDGQIAGPSNTIYATPIRYPIPGARKVDVVSVTYHTLSGHAAVHVLGTDGTIWGSGPYDNGTLGNGLTTGSTGTSQTPVLFSDPQVDFATGSIFWNAQSNRCIDNNGGSSTNGNKIQLYDCNGSAAQGWILGKAKQLTNMGTGKCLDDPGNSATPGVALQLYDCNGTAAQQFALTGGNKIVHIASGLCVDATGNGTANGTVMELWTCNGGGAQTLTTWQGINGWQGMVTGTDHFCGLRNDQWSGMWCAGSNAYGQLANYASSTYNFLGQCVSTPSSGHNIFNVNLPGGDRVDLSKLSDNWRSQFQSTMVIATSGKVYGAGRNQYGKLGNGTVGPGTDYAQCVTTQYPLPAGVTAVDMSTLDEYTTYILGSDNKIYAAGGNGNGQVGDSTTTDRWSPVEVKIPRQSYVY